MSTWYDRWNHALQAQHQLLFDQEKMAIKDEYAVITACPVCEYTDFSPWFEKDWFRWVRCKKCSMVYMRPRLNDEATHQFYNSEANAIYNESKFEQVTGTSVFDDHANLSNLKMIDHYQGSMKGNLLEIGSGKGYLLKMAKGLGYQICGLELNQKLCRYSRELLEDPGSILEVDLLDAKFPPATFDVIYMRDLIQHIPNPTEFLQECNRIAKPGCIIFIGTHNIDGLIPKIVRSRYTPVFGFMEPSHYSPKTITNLLARFGFRVRKIEFESLDCTISEIINYFLTPTFTTVFCGKVNSRHRSILRLLRAPFMVFPLKNIEKMMLPKIANWFKMGSWMNVLAEKRA
jgi:2-polyprenyl-3-methyl-5-hydroxy-6-metoxy-1,4-benzoquinol methylase